MYGRMRLLKYAARRALYEKATRMAAEGELWSAYYFRVERCRAGRHIANHYQIRDCEERPPIGKAAEKIDGSKNIVRQRGGFHAEPRRSRRIADGLGFWPIPYFGVVS
jgi:hypothetical protein